MSTPEQGAEPMVICSLVFALNMTGGNKEETKEKRRKGMRVNKKGGEKMKSKSRQRPRDGFSKQNISDR